MIYWNVGPQMRRRGIANAHQLVQYAKARGVTLNVQTAYNVLSTEPVERINAPLLESLARALGVKGKPWALLRVEP